MATIVSRIYDALGVLIGEEQIEVPDAPAAPDLATLAERFAELEASVKEQSATLDQLIIAELTGGVF